MLADNWYDVVPPPFVTAAALCVLLVLLWLLRGRLAELIRALGLQRISAFGVDLQFTDNQVSEAYRKQQLGEPSEEDKAAVRDAVRWLSPLAGQAHILWVDDNPSNNTVERAMFLSWEIEVQTVRSTDDALRELSERTTEPAPVSGKAAEAKPYFDLVISDWSRKADDTPTEPAGLQLLRRMRPGHEQPVILYHGVVPAAESASRRDRALEAGAVGTTADPGELFRWTLFELVRMAFDHPNPVQRRRRASFTPAAVRSDGSTRA